MNEPTASYEEVSSELQYYRNISDKLEARAARLEMAVRILLPYRGAALRGIQRLARTECKAAFSTAERALEYTP